MSGNTYVIGDVQGCYDELRLLLDKINFDPVKDTLWFAGDLVNRGKASLKVLEFVKSLGDKHITVLGNHDLHLLAVAYEFQSIKKVDTFQDVLQSENRDELLNWLRYKPFLHYDESFDFVMTHAGISPKWTLQDAIRYGEELKSAIQSDQFFEILKNMYGDEPAVWEESLIGMERYRFLINVFTRMRYCDRHGALELKIKGPPAEVQTDQLIPWFHVPNRACSKTNIVFGHWASLSGVTNTPHVFAVDTGCAWGYELTALSLGSLRRFSVKKV